MTEICVFPGQGSQKVGMGGGLFERFPDEVALADRILGYSISSLCLDDPKKQLHLTEYTQPALYVVNALSYRALIQQLGKPPVIVAGHSLGEYNALHVAGAFNFEEGLRIVLRRSLLMSQISTGGMAAVIGLTPESVIRIIKKADFESIDIASYNAPNQIVLSGPLDILKLVREVIIKENARFFPLKVGGPFHSRYMNKAACGFSDYLTEINFLPLKIKTISNYTGRPFQNDSIKASLENQINHTVRWVETVEYLLDQPNPRITEVGPGNVLTGLIKKIKTAQNP